MINSDAEKMMHAALEEARKAEKLGEVPVGAIVVVENNIVATAFNEVEAGQDATLHAEMLALKRASAKLGRWRLDDATVYVTLEPCSMCIGAMILSRVKNLYFGAWDPRQGAVGSLFDLSQQPQLPHKITVYPEVLKSESEELLKSFFLKCRNRA
ncbi:MAG: tRNA adenosine(34) deaminase TadA [Bdellovibrionota bacterium]